MMGLLESAYVIGRRDFTATVFSKAFIFFLLGPVILLGVSFLLGGVGERMARQDMRSSVAVIASEAEFNAIEAAQTRLAPAFQDYERSEEHTSELQSLMRISYAVFCLKKNKNTNQTNTSIE